MNSLAVSVLALLCCSVAMAGYARTYYHSGHKSHHLGGAAYAYHAPKYVVPAPVHYAKPVLHHAAPVHYAKPVLHHAAPVHYAKPVVHHAAPIVYAHKSYSKPHTTHYIKPVVHAAPVYSKPSHYLGGHAYGIGYKPLPYSHAIRPVVYAHKPHYHH